MSSGKKKKKGHVKSGGTSILHDVILPVIKTMSLNEPVPVEAALGDLALSLIQLEECEPSFPLSFARALLDILMNPPENPSLLIIPLPASSPLKPTPNTASRPTSSPESLAFGRPKPSVPVMVPMRTRHDSHPRGPTSPRGSGFTPTSPLTIFNNSHLTNPHNTSNSPSQLQTHNLSNSTNSAGSASNNTSVSSNQTLLNPNGLSTSQGQTIFSTSPVSTSSILIQNGAVSPPQAASPTNSGVYPITRGASGISWSTTTTEGSGQTSGTTSSSSNSNPDSRDHPLRSSGNRIGNSTPTKSTFSFITEFRKTTALVNMEPKVPDDTLGLSKIKSDDYVRRMRTPEKSALIENPSVSPSHRVKNLRVLPEEIMSPPPKPHTLRQHTTNQQNPAFYILSRWKRLYLPEDK